MATFRGGVFSKEVPDGRAGAEISVGAHGLVARTVDGQLLNLDPADCTLDLGGASGRMWFCKRTDGGLTFYSEAPGFDAALAGVPRLRGKVLEMQRGDLERRRQRRVWGALLLVGLTVLAVGGYFGVRAAAREAMLSLPESADRKLGELAIASMDLGGPVVDDTAITGPIEHIVARLSESDDAAVNYNVRVVEAPVLNAFALPGGEVVVYTGLIRVAPDADAIAAVIAHEMGHVIKRHGLQRVAQSIGVAAAVQLLAGDVGGVSALLIELLRTGALTSYGRDQEREADRVGLRILQRGGIPPESMAEIFRVFEREHGDVPAELSWLSSHPALKERIAAVEKAAQAMAPQTKRPLGVDFAALRAALNAPLKESTGAGDHPPPPDLAQDSEQDKDNGDRNP